MPGRIEPAGFQPRNTPAERRAFFDLARRSAPLNSWPVGSVFISVADTDPAELLGGGTWERFAQGQMLVGQTDGDTDFDTAEETGGAKTHTLVEANLPAHAHTMAHTHEHVHTHPIDHNHAAFDIGGGTHNHSAKFLGAALGAAAFARPASLSFDTETTITTSAVPGSHIHTVDIPNFTGTSGAASDATTGGSSAANTGSVGSGTAVNHMPPYVVVYMWKRTA